jgi:hypothetical protein
MKIVNWYSPSETKRVQQLRKRFAKTLYVATSFKTEEPNTWHFESMRKGTVEWTKRLLVKFLETDEEYLIKIDPDTTIKRLPKPPEGCDVAGDFRRAPIGWIWLGAYQYFTRNAAEKLLADPEYKGVCAFQDYALCQSVIRTGLKAYNMPEVNGWSKTPGEELITHPGRTEIPRAPFGIVDWQA